MLPIAKYNMRVIQALDLFFAAIGIMCAFPIGLVVALAVKLDSKGPFFFIQERLGRYKKPFKLIKFRTMVFNAEEKGPVWAHKNDRRVTRIGRFLRKNRLDEIPQLLNILKGDISFVGPRPVVKSSAELLQQYNRDYDKRFLVKPGLTGWSQIYWSHSPSIEEQLKKVPYDLRYLNNYSVKDYFKILFLTVRTVFIGKGV